MLYLNQFSWHEWVLQNYNCSAAFFTRLLLLPLEKPSLNRKYSAAMKSCPVFKGLGLNCRTNNYGAHAGGVEWEGRRSNLTCLSGIDPL